MREQTKPGETPKKITVSMIDQDLKDGISKPEMAIKYGIKPWEVDEMFKHPFLKGRRPSRKKALSFTFVDDTEPLNSGDIAVEQAAEVDPNQSSPNVTSNRRFVGDDLEEVNPNQVTLEDAIDDAIESATQAQAAMGEALEAVEEIFPTQQDEEEKEEEVVVQGGEESEEVEEEEEEIEMDDNTFEL